MFFKEIYFANPEYLWLLILIPFVLFWTLFWRNKKQPTLKISTVKGFLKTSNFISKISPFLSVLRIISLVFLVLAIARPQKVDISSRKKTKKGIDIVMAIDISSSMLAQDLKPNRLEALKRVAEEFVNDRISDRIGLVLYAGESYTKVPITTDKSIIKSALRSIKFEGIIENGTAIGMGLATAVNRLKNNKSKSKVIILLTDGVNNTGFIDPKIASELAVEFGIKTYTIGLGSNGNARAPVAILPNGQFQYAMAKVEIDEVLLKSIAKKTGGLYFRATDNKKLKEIYAEINKLEKTEIEEFEYYNYKEKYRFLTFLSLAFILLEWILRNTIFRSFI